jgi:hypothetical protein
MLQSIAKTPVSGNQCWRGLFRILGAASMPKAKKASKRLSAADFAGEGEPYGEVTVTISIRILGTGITRSRLAVNVYPDPALEPLARQSLRVLGVENYGFNEEGVFGACLSKNFDGWEDLEDDYPKFDEGAKDRYHAESAKLMNEYVKHSVDWVLALNKQGMEEAAKSIPDPRKKGLLM